MKTEKSKQYRQGDVLLERVDSIPRKGLTKVPRVDGKIVVALGSSNGNPHSILEKGSEMFRDEDGDQFLVLVGRRLKGTYPVLQDERSWLVVDTGDLGKIAFHKEDVVQIGSDATVSGRFALLQHAEHTPIALPAGNYNHVPQRGFNRGEIRRVQD